MNALSPVRNIALYFAGVFSSFKLVGREVPGIIASGRPREVLLRPRAPNMIKKIFRSCMDAMHARFSVRGGGNLGFGSICLSLRVKATSVTYAPAVYSSSRQAKRGLDNSHEGRIPGPRATAAQVGDEVSAVRLTSPAFVSIM